MRLLIVIPAFNEEANIVRVVEELQSVAGRYDYIVVNDGSLDQTAALCRAHGFPLLDLPVNLGLTGAFQAGIRYACDAGYDAVIQLDADGQHDPRYILPMLKCMEEENLDLVIGSRFVTVKRPRTLRMAGNALIERLIRLTTHETISDPTSGMRLYGKRLIWRMAYGLNLRPEPDTIAYLIRCGAKVKEVQVEMRERIAGESYLTFTRSLRYMLQTGLNILMLQFILRKEDLTCPGQ